MLGEAALVRRSLDAAGQPAVQVFQAHLAALPDVPAMQAALTELLGGLLPAGECALPPILEEAVDDNDEAEEAAAGVPVVAPGELRDAAAGGAPAAAGGEDELAGVRHEAAAAAG